MLTKQRANKEKSSNSPHSHPIIELRRILNGEEKLDKDNPKLRLSINDYSKMCDNKILRNMMAKALYTDLKSLTAFCKIVARVGEHIDLSKKTIKEKKVAKAAPIRMLLTDLPVDTLGLISDHYQSLLRYELIDWVKAQSDKLDFNILSGNTNAIDFLTLPENIKNINYFNLSHNSNPNALLLIQKKIIEEKKLSRTEYEKLSNRVDWVLLSVNPIAIEILETYKNDIVWSALCRNPNPEALRLIKKELQADSDSDKIDWEALSANPIIIQLIEENPQYMKYIDYSGLSANPSDEAIRLLKNKLEEEPDEIDYAMLSENTNQEALKLLNRKIKEDPDEIDWVRLAGNTAPEAIKILKKNLDKLDLDNSDWEVFSALSSNPSDEAINLLKSNREKIDWTALSSNTNLKAIKILKENQTGIYWPALSGNPSIFNIK